MENAEQAKQFIREAKNICLIPEKNEPESIVSALALFYTLKELNKNVNLIIEELPENLKFLTPSSDFISYPKNFVISIPDKVAQISQIYYEKNNESLKIHLTVENGNIKKDSISFYFSEAKPDLIITLGISDYHAQLESNLNSFGFLLDSPILNIDSKQNNKKFGRINIIGDSSISEIIMSLAGELNSNSMGKEESDCLLAGLVIYTENFKSRITADIFKAASDLMKNGADLKNVAENLFPETKLRLNKPL